MNNPLLVFRIFIFINIVPVNSSYFNFTSLMIHYLTLCGPESFCNITQFSFRNLDFSFPRNHKLCPDWFCDNLCFGRGNCCPDKYFALSGLVCDNVTSVNATRDQSRDQRSSFLLIKKLSLWNWSTHQRKVWTRSI